MKFLLTFTAALIINAALFQTVSAQKGIPNAAGILLQSQNKYAAMPLYLDSGKAVQEFYNLPHPHKEVKLFKTAYSATVGFNFEFYVVGNSNSLYNVNRTGNVVKTWWGITNQNKTWPRLRDALSAAKGVSSSISYMIPGLLLTQDLGRENFLSKIVGPAITGTEVVNGSVCYKIDGYDIGVINPSKISVWIGQKDLLVHKVVTDKTISPSRMPANHKIDSIQKVHGIKPNTADFSVKCTYSYFPYTAKVADKHLFEFKPNRKVQL